MDILGFWDDETLVQRYRVRVDRIVQWVLSMQLAPNNNDDDDEMNDRAGFRGGSFLSSDDKYEQSHLAMTYTALCILATLSRISHNDDNKQHSNVLNQLNKNAIIHKVKELQNEDGSFQCIQGGSENDLRFLYCACAISHMLNDWSGVSIERAMKYIESCHTYDGAFSLIPGNEGHGGSTYCAVASLVLMNQLDTFLTTNNNRRLDLIHWCVSRQQTIHGGFQGRPNKAEDTCYSYWIGGTLCLLKSQQYIDRTALSKFVLQCQTDMGGFSKLYNGTYPDILHSFYSLAWLSLASDNDTSTSTTQQPNGSDKYDDIDSLNLLDCTLGMCKKRTIAFQIAFDTPNNTH